MKIFHLFFIVVFACSSTESKILNQLAIEYPDNCTNEEIQFEDTLSYDSIQMEYKELEVVLLGNEYMKELYNQALNKNKTAYHNNIQSYKNCKIRYLCNDFLQIADDHQELIAYYRDKIDFLEEDDSLLRIRLRADSMLLYLDEEWGSIFVFRRYALCDSSIIIELFASDENINAVFPYSYIDFLNE